MSFASFRIPGYFNYAIQHLPQTKRPHGLLPNIYAKTLQAATQENKGKIENPKVTHQNLTDLNLPDLRSELGLRTNGIVQWIQWIASRMPQAFSSEEEDFCRFTAITIRNG